MSKISFANLFIEYPIYLQSIPMKYSNLGNSKVVNEEYWTKLIKSLTSPKPIKYLNIQRSNDNSYAWQFLLQILAFAVIFIKYHVAIDHLVINE